MWIRDDWGVVVLEYIVIFFIVVMFISVVVVGVKLEWV